MTTKAQKNENIKEYLKGFLERMDGCGIILTDDDLINEGLEECGDFTNLVAICNEEETPE